MGVMKMKAQKELHHSDGRYVIGAPKQPTRPPRSLPYYIIANCMILLPERSVPGSFHPEYMIMKPIFPARLTGGHTEEKGCQYPCDDDDADDENEND